MSNVSNPVFDPTCPDGGQFYACGNGAKFVGCCGRDPCNDAGCSAGDLRTMSFNSAYWGTPDMPDQQCTVAGQQWWSCAKTDPPFLGCCSINPCTSGCPQANLIQGTLSSVASIANAYDPQPPLSSSNNTNTTTTVNTTSNSHSSGMSSGLLVGISCAAAAALALSIALIWWLVRRSRQKGRPYSTLDPTLVSYAYRGTEKRDYFHDTSSVTSPFSSRGTPVPPYGLHHRDQYQQLPPIVHEADPANQVYLPPASAFTSPATSSPNSHHQRYSDTSSSMTVSTLSPYHPQVSPSGLRGEISTSTRSPINGLGIHPPVEIGDSVRRKDEECDERSQVR